MNRAPWTTVGHAFRRTALPLVSYYAITLAVPLANGAAQSGAFVEHALAVLFVPPIAIVLACAVHKIAHALARACDPKLASQYRWLRGLATRALFGVRLGRSIERRLEKLPVFLESGIPPSEPRRVRPS